jgi:NADH dehydrogenase
MNLIIGATGMLGSEICRLLIDRGQKVKALIRNTSDRNKTTHLENLGVELVVGDLLDKVSLSKALEGVNYVISTASSMPFSYLPGKNDIELVDRKGLINLVRCADKAGVKQFIYTSFSGKINVEFPLSKAKRKVEDELKKSNMYYTILRPSYFMEVWMSPAVGFDVEKETVQVYGTGTNPVSYISYFDLARIAVETMKNPDTENKVLELGGPEKLSQLDVINIFENICSARFTVNHVPEEALISNLTNAKDPMEKSFAGLMLALAHGDPIDMQEMKTIFPFRMKTVREFAESVVPAESA